MVLAFMVVLAGCGKGESDNTKSNEKIKINTTVFPLKSFAEQIGGKHVEVNSIYPAGTDLHNYEPT
ncbi:zinc ABC transporter substrate-binding protein, partial [Staphylococcus gallinarum]